MKDEKNELELVQEFDEFLTGTCPDSITIKEGYPFGLTPEQAFSIIWYLQEHWRIISDRYERCSECGNIYHTESEGHHNEATLKDYCGWCYDPEYDKREQ